MNLLRTIKQKLCRKLKCSQNFLHDKSHYDEVATLQCTISYNKYGGYCVPLSSSRRPAAKKILLNNIHEPHTIEFIVSHCGEGDVVHAGTYFGDFLPGLSKGLASNAKLWAFEPNKENYRCAKITIELNELDNVVLENAGLGAKSDLLLMKVTDNKGRSLGGGSHLISKDDDESGMGVEEVKIVTIDDVVGNERDVSIIQLDVEGHEKEAISGALETIRRCRPIIILEVLPNSNLLDSEWFSEKILSIGYEKSADVHRNSVYVCKNG